MESFDYMNFLGEINMKTAEIELCVYEECMYTSACLDNKSECLPTCHSDPDKHGTTRHKLEGDGQFIAVYFGKLVRSPSP